MPHLNKWPSYYLMIILISTFLFSTMTWANCQQVDGELPNKPIKVAIKFSPPFVFEANVTTQNNQGWDGIAVELWKSIAECLHIDSEFKEYVDDSSLLKAIENNDVDLAIGVFVPSAEIENRVDFSHSYFQGHLGAMVSDQSGLSNIGRLFSKFPLIETLTVLAILLSLMVITALIYWRAEHSKSNPLFTDGPLRGFYNAMIWSTILVFSGRGSPFEVKHKGGQVLMILLIFFGVSIGSIVTALLTSTLTLQGLGAQITSVDELVDKRVAYMESLNTETQGISTDTWLKNHNVTNLMQALSWPQAVSALQDGRLEAVIHSREVMQYLVKADYVRNVNVLPLNLNQTDYAFMLPNYSPLRENINRQLLSLIKTEFWQQRLADYLEN